MTIPILSPSRHDFPEDWKPPTIGHGLYANTCRECGATIMGHKYRRTCRVCVEIFKKQTDQQLRNILGTALHHMRARLSELENNARTHEDRKDLQNDIDRIEKVREQTRD